MEIYAEACKSCLYCVKTCPKKVLGTTDAVNSKGYQYAVPVNPDACIGCAMCATICPGRGDNRLQGGEVTWLRRYS